MSRHQHLRTLVVGTMAYRWRVQRQDPGTVTLRVWAAERPRRDFPLEVSIRFDDPWLNYGPIIAATPEQRERAFRLSPVTPAQVREIVEAAVRAGWDPQRPAERRRFAWDPEAGLRPEGRAGEGDEPNQTTQEQRSMAPAQDSPREQPVVQFAEARLWAAWLDEHHAASPGVWLRIAKKASGAASVTYDEALEVALCYGWIDGQKKSYDDASWLQKFTPRGPKSIWSKVNRAKAEALAARGDMRPAGLAAVEQAKRDGRWDAAYDSQGSASIPEDFQAALDRNEEARAFFATLNSRNRYAVLFRIQTAKKAETRARRIEQFVQMLANHETLYP